MNNSIIDLNNEELKSFSHDTFKKYTKPRFKWVIEVNKWHEFYKGNHFNYNQNFYNRPVNVGSISRVVNYSAVLIENKRNQILQNEPVPVVKRNLSVDNGQDAEDVAITYERLIEDVFEDNGLPILSDDMVLNGCIDNTAFMQVNTTNANKSGIRMDMLDWYDVIMYPGIKDIQKSPLIGKMFTGIIGEVKADPSYIQSQLDKIVPQEKYRGEDEYDGQKKEDPEKQPQLKVDDFNSFQAVEWQTPVYVNDDVKKHLSKLEVNGQKPYSWIDQKEDGERIMRLFTVSQGRVIRDQYLDYDRYNIFAYSPQSGSYYNSSIFARLISANKSYDNLVSQIELFMAYANKFRVFIPQNTKMADDWDNPNGQIIRYDGDAPIVPPQPMLSPAVLQYVAKLEATMQFLVNFHAQSLGETGTGAKKAQANKQAINRDTFNTSPSIRRYSKFLEDVTKFVIYLKANNMKYQDYTYMHAGKRTDTTIIGDAYKKHIMKNVNPTEIPQQFVNKITSATTIRSDVPVKIKIASGLDYRDENIINKIWEAIKEGDLPKQAMELVLDDGRIAPYFKIAREEAQKASQQQQQQQSQEQDKQAQLEKQQSETDAKHQLMIELVKNPEIIPKLQMIGKMLNPVMQQQQPQQSAQPMSQQPENPGQTPQPQMPQQPGMSAPANTPQQQGQQGGEQQQQGQEQSSDQMLAMLEKKAPFDQQKHKSSKHKKKK